MNLQRLRNRSKAMNQKGIGLLELMLALAIIALLLIMATRYYQSTREAQLVSQAAQQVNAVIAASANWVIGNPAGYDANLTWDALRGQGLLPASFGALNAGNPISPFGSPMTLVPGSDPASYTISFLATATACTALTSRFNVDANITADSQGCPTVTVVYSAT